MTARKTNLKRKKLKYNLLSWKEHMPKDTADDEKGTPELSLKRVMAIKSTFGQFYPRSVQVAEAVLAILVSGQAHSHKPTVKLKLPPPPWSYKI